LRFFYKLVCKLQNWEFKHMPAVYLRTGGCVV
jgi:hypothetical protein